MTPTVDGTKKSARNTNKKPAPSLIKSTGIIFKYKHPRSNNKPTILPGNLICRICTIKEPNKENKYNIII